MIQVENLRKDFKVSRKMRKELGGSTLVGNRLRLCRWASPWVPCSGDGEPDRHSRNPFSINVLSANRDGMTPT